MSPSSPDEPDFGDDRRGPAALAVYGTLAPGERNHHHVAGLAGTWTQGVVLGHLHSEGWGATYGFPGLVLDPSGPPVPVQVLRSPDLPDHWARLDAFEGPAYARVVTTVQTANEVVRAQIYALAGGMGIAEHSQGWA